MPEEQISSLSRRKIAMLIDGDNAIESMGDVAPLPVDLAIARAEEAWIFSTGSPSLDRAAFEAAHAYVGLPYDSSYDFDDQDTTFCSKLLWNALRDVGYAVPEPVHIRNLNWQPYAKELAFEGARYGLSLEQVLNRRVVTPKQMADCLIEIDFLF